ncbi:MAG TPA: ATP-dependent DNA ligase [Actinomycetales bacterium]|jgi:DNA ligase-1
MLLAEVAAASRAITDTASRSAKTALLAACLTSAARDDDPGTLPVVVAYLAGELPQRRTGLGRGSLRGAPPAGPGGLLVVAEVDAALSRSEALAGTGTATARRALLHALLARADADEQRLLVGLVTGDLRQGAARSLVLDAVAAAAGLPPAVVRRATTVSGSPAEVAVSALREGAAGLAAYGLQVGRALSPMLAQSAPTLAQALERTGPAGVEAKLDGIRVQVHRDGPTVRVFTRSLDEITDRLPEVVEAVSALPLTSVVLDGEVLVLAGDGRPRPFQHTAARTARRGDPREAARTEPLTLFVFDVLHLDGVDVLDEPGSRRREVLEDLWARRAPTSDGARDLAVLTARADVTDPGDRAEVARAEALMADTLGGGHEGVVVKSLAAPYAMGRRGAGWVKVKPVHTLDLVVLAAEWGSGRRTGLLSNLHLGARDPEGRFGEPGGFVMLGKTFKGLTDAMLTWQTERLQQLAVTTAGADRGWVVPVRPELVVEIALDGLQTSPRYPASVALRFARVVRHRPDRAASEADTIDAVLALAAGD